MGIELDYPNTPEGRAWAEKQIRRYSNDFGSEVEAHQRRKAGGFVEREGKREAIDDEGLGSNLQIRR